MPVQNSQRRNVPELNLLELNDIPYIIQHVLTEIKMGTAFIYLYSVIVDTLALFTLADIVPPFSAHPRLGDRSSLSRYSRHRASW